MGADFLRKMDWLGRDRATAYLRIFAALNVLSLIFLLVTSHHGVDRFGHLLCSDFISFWTSGRMLHLGENPYDSEAHTLAQRRFFASDDSYTAFFYPPSFLPFCWPLGALGYFPALVVWLILTGAVYFTAVKVWWRSVGDTAPLWLLCLSFPAIPIVITHGQTAFLIAGLLGLGVWLVPSRPVLAGVLFGLATIKPQFGILLPLVLLLTREWLVIVAATLTTIALGGLSTWLFGMDVWPDWLAASQRAEQAMAAGAVGYAKMSSPFAAMKLWGAGDAVAYAVQIAISISVAIMLARAAWGRRWSAGIAAATLAAAPLVTPFVLDYDMVLLTFPLLWLAGEGLRHGFSDWDKLVIALAFAAAAFARPLAINVNIPIMPMIISALFYQIWRQIRHSPV